jgi:hypothetical protein
LEATLGATENAVERKQLCEKKVNVDVDIDVWLCGVGDGRKSGPKTVFGPGRDCPLPSNVPTLRKVNVLRRKKTANFVAISPRANYTD